MITTVLVLMFSVYTSSCDLERLAGSYTLLYIILFYYLNPKCNKLPFSDTGTCCSIFSFPSFYTSIHTPLVLPSPSELYIFKIVISSIFIWNGFCTYFNPAHFTCCQSRQQSQVKESWSCKFFFTFDRYPLARVLLSLIRILSCFWVSEVKYFLMSGSFTLLSNFRY